MSTHIKQCRPPVFRALQSSSSLTHRDFSCCYKHFKYSVSGSFNIDIKAIFNIKTPENEPKLKHPPIWTTPPTMQRLKRDRPFFDHVIASDQWGVSLQAQCGCRDVRRNGDGRDGFRGQSRPEYVTKQKPNTGSLNICSKKHSQINNSDTGGVLTTRWSTV